MIWAGWLIVHVPMHGISGALGYLSWTPPRCLFVHPTRVPKAKRPFIPSMRLFICMQVWDASEAKRYMDVWMYPGAATDISMTYTSRGPSV